MANKRLKMMVLLMGIVLIASFNTVGAELSGSRTEETTLVMTADFGVTGITDNQNNYLYWAEQTCATIMERFRPKMLPPAGRWHYHQGVFLKGMLLVWERTGDERYFEYVKAYVDNLVDKKGRFYYQDTELDSIQAGLLLFDLYKMTGDERYKIAADELISFLIGWRKNPEGGYWHKERYPNQMWLDGLYMAGPFAVQYGATFKRPELFDLVIEQAELMLKYAKDENTSLLYHAWDSSKRAVWADPVTGKSPEFWSRSLGWMVIALNEILDYLPGDHPKRQLLIDSQHDLLHAIIKQQDPQTGLWFQVTDKGFDPSNWQETSASCLFVAGIAKAVRLGYVEADCLPAAQRGWAGIMELVMRDEKGRVNIPEICIGTGVGDYVHYLNRPRSENDLHGVGAYVFACMELDKLN